MCKLSTLILNTTTQTYLQARAERQAVVVPGRTQGELARIIAFLFHHWLFSKFNIEVVVPGRMQGELAKVIAFLVVLDCFLSIVCFQNRR